MTALTIAQTRRDIAACNSIAQRSEEDCARMLRVVLATIQQRMETVPAIVNSFATVGHRSKYAFGHKRVGLRYIADNSAAIYADAMAARGDADAMLRAFLQVPGLGLVKAGFSAQLFDNQAGCLDTHNIALYGLTASRFDGYRQLRREDSRAKLRRAYLECCATLGGSVQLWRNWCNRLAALRPASFEHGAEVSALHITLLRGDAVQSPQYGLDFTPEYRRAA